MYLKNKILYILIVATIMCVFSCTTNEPDLGPVNEEFFGIYIVRDSSEVEDLGQVDSIHFNVYQGTTYSIDFFEITDSGDIVDFCDHSGTILDFGTAKAEFDPYGFSQVNCDTLNVPRGMFVADFINFGDTILLYKELVGDTYDSVFIIKLLK